MYMYLHGRANDLADHRREVSFDVLVRFGHASAVVFDRDHVHRHGVLQHGADLITHGPLSTSRRSEPSLEIKLWWGYMYCFCVYSLERGVGDRAGGLGLGEQQANLLVAHLGRGVDHPAHVAAGRAEHLCRSGCQSGQLPRENLGGGGAYLLAALRAEAAGGGGGEACQAEGRRRERVRLVADTTEGNAHHIHSLSAVPTDRT